MKDHDMTALRRLVGAGLLVIFAAVPLAAQESRPAISDPPRPEAQIEIESALRKRLHLPIDRLDVDFIMLGDELSGFAPTDLRWDIESDRAVFRWRRFGDDRFRDFTFDPRSGALEALADDAEAPLVDEEIVWNHEFARGLFVRDGDLFLFRSDKSERVRLTETTTIESSPQWTSDETGFLFERDGEWYLRKFDGAYERQLSNFGKTPESAPPLGDRRTLEQTTEAKKEIAPTSRPADQAAFLKEEELRLLRAVFDEAERKKDRRAPERKSPARFRLPSDLSVRFTIAARSGDHLAVRCGKKADGTRSTVMPRFITDSGYVATDATRAKVGDREGPSYLIVVDTATGASRLIDFGDDHAGDLLRILFSPSGKNLVAMTRSIDNKRARIHAVDLATGKTRVVFTVDDPAWVYHLGDFCGFLPKSEVLWFVAERSGYVHLSTIDLSTGVENRLTDGLWEVRNCFLDARRNRFILHTSEASPHETQAYALSSSGGARVPLTKDRGRHAIDVSPDGGFILDFFSFADSPIELYVRRSDEDVRLGLRVTKSPSPAFESRKWIMPEIVSFKGRDGASVPMRLYRPKTPRAHRPAVVFVHGAGYLQNVHWGWSRYAREYLFHDLLCERGYHVVDVDYRGSAGYGRNWRTANYRAMGSLDLSDQVDAVRWLIENCGVDSKSVGIYGGSYGGFITLMALFKEADVFRSGAALRPVTDWAHYNHGYTSNILNLPHEDAEAYRRSSPIYFAEGLRGDLLIEHGMVDDNVHYQDSVRLAQRLIELRKSNWELASFPNENHGFVDPAAWADEFRRILSLFERTIGIAPDRRP